MHTLLRPGDTVVTPEPGEPSGRPRAVGDERDKPHTGEGTPERLLVDGEVPRRSEVPVRHPAHDAVQRIEECQEALFDFKDTCRCGRAGVWERAPDNEVDAVAVDPVPVVGPPEVGADGAS